ncbi:MAG: ATP-dependent RecD-like DNA helicase [Lentisphaerae bacterium ADurb.BinA184]|nr:MAG: ATP-dependent RecD-like DNA helicase [Lentisphaerae bacterium ADurb.BinA184]
MTAPVKDDGQLLFGDADRAAAADGGEPAITDATVRGEVLRVVYASENGQYVVLRLVDGERHEHTLVGPMQGVLEGQDIEASGRWETHKEHGRQLRVARFRALLPTSAKGIERYLASGLIHGIGEKYAERIVERFGTETLEILDKYSSRLREVPGIGPRRIEDIRRAWQENSQRRETFIFLQGLGLSPNLCARLFAAYGAGAGEIVRQNPYRLAGEIHGVGFLTADRIAGELGVGKENPLRLAAGAVYALDRLADDGHVCFPRDALVERAAELLSVTPESASAGVQRAVTDGAVVAERVGADGVETLYHHRLYAAERGLGESLRVLLASPLKDPGRLPTGGGGFDRLNDRQREAVEKAFRSHLSIITGGPGVGKTTVVGVIVETARRLRWRVYLAAPTGRAAKRLAESAGREARTVHRLLKWEPATRAFVYNRERPLTCELLVVDETSMLDVELSNHLFAAIEGRTRVVLVGDRDQLPSVGPGAVLHDLIASGRVPVTHLTEIYRQEEGSRIVTNAHAANHGQMPDLRTPHRDVAADFYWIDQEDPERVVQILTAMVAERIPRRFGFDPVRDVQVLTPMNRGVCGANNLNAVLQGVLNPGPKPQFHSGERTLKSGDRVMQVVNNYDKGVFNGELGRIGRIDSGNRKFTVHYDAEAVEYEWGEADQVRLAYAVTVHKSQGSEYPVVLMPVLTQHFVMLQRNLIYTGMTRARRLLIMVGTRKALAIAIHNDRPAVRCTRLRERLTAPPAPLGGQPQE